MLDRDLAEAFYVRGDAFLIKSITRRREHKTGKGVDTLDLEP
jgi:hypothetical protein